MSIDVQYLDVYHEVQGDIDVRFVYNEDNELLILSAGIVGDTHMDAQYIDAELFSEIRELLLAKLNKPDRPIKELLVLVREFILDDEYFYGLCGVVYDLSKAESITDTEYDVMSNYLDNHRPDKIGDFWWPSGNKQLRLDWIDEQLKLK